MEVSSPLLWPAMSRIQTKYSDAQALSQIRFLDILTDKKSAKLILSKLEKLQGLHLQWIGDMREDAADEGFSRCEVLGWLLACPRLEELNLSGSVDFAMPLQSFMDFAKISPIPKL
ncbi:hypothetical protein N7478_002033 [Penicillium angulare]|uniref:uncharacterized protein n=1 Tax=Penicillium angulare TaxID=116970 RepID=UPI002540DF5B|nr:uncharacterized protein N7478_002033 [Penicillium angulare]KAJ5289003.1 hypothetical protein N7478_002033 [Penicillium angulare]